ncbi:hypothetical protein ACWEOH_03605 [Agromyces sp. NPDC004153]
MRWTAAATVLRALVMVGVGAMVGVGLAFGIALVGIVVVQEALWELSRDLRLDPLARAAMGVVLVVAAALAVMGPVVVALERYAALRSLERHDQEHPEVVPEHAARRLIRSPGGIIRWTGWIVAGVAALVAVACAWVLITESDEDELTGGAIAAGVAVLAVVLGIVCAPVSRAVDSRWERRAAPLRERWSGAQGAAEAAERRRRDAAVADDGPLEAAVGRRAGRALAAVVGALLVGICVFFVSVTLRQPCRNCDEVRYVGPVETGIDVLSLAGGILTGAAAAVLVAAFIAGIVPRLLRERAAARWVSDGRARRAPAERLMPLLIGPRAAETAAQGFGAVAAMAFIAGVAADWSASELLQPALLVIVALVAAGLGVLADLIDAAPRYREREALRKALSPGDLDPDPPAPVVGDSGSSGPL